MPLPSNIVIDGGIPEINDFGGMDTYTISPTLTGDVIIRDNDASRINLPAGMNVTAVQFLSNGVQFEVNGHTVRFLGRPDLFTFVFGGNPLDPAAGSEETFTELAASFGASIPLPGEPAVPATIVGEIQDDGTVGPPGPVPGDWTLTQDVTQVHEASSVTYTVTLDGPATEDTVVDFTVVADATVDNQGTNKANLNDFSSGSLQGSVTIAAGAQTATFTVTPFNDGITELNETYQLKAEVGGQSKTVTTTILDGAAGGGQTFTLTTGPDAIPGLVGSKGTTDNSGDDTIVASDATLNASDLLDGGLGNDFLRYASSGAAAVTESGFEIKSVEKIHITSDATGGTTFDFTGVTGANTIRNYNSSNDLTITGLKTLTPTIEIASLGHPTVGPNTTVTYDASVITGKSDSIQLNVSDNLNTDGSAVGNVTINGIETINIDSSDGASKFASIASNSLQNMMIVGDSNLSIADAQFFNTAAVNEVNASTFEGNLDITLGNANAANIDVAVTGGKGDDRADFSIGFDKNDAFDGGDGTDTLGLSNNSAVLIAPTADFGTISNVEILEITDGGTDVGATKLDLDNFAGVNTVYYSGLTGGNGLAAATSVADVASDFTVKVNNPNAQNLTTTLKTNGTSDILNLQFEKIATVGENTGIVTAANFETVNLMVTDDTNDGGIGTLTIPQLAINNATTLNMTGDAHVKINNDGDPATPVLTTLNAESMTGQLTLTGVDLIKTGATVTLGSGNDTFNVANADGADTITLGLGNDLIRYTAVAQSDRDMDTITDFVSGTDRIDLTFNAALVATNWGGGGVAGVDTFITSTQFAGNRATFALAQGALSGTGVSVVYQQDEQILWLDANKDGTLDNNDFRIHLDGVASITAADLGFGTGVTFTANKNGFDTLLVADSNEATMVTNEDDIVNATVAQINNAGTNLTTLNGTDTVNITGTGVADLTIGASAGDFETVTLGNGVTGLTTAAADITNVTTLTGDAGTPQTLTLNDADDLSGVNITKVETLSYGAAVNLTIDEANLASFSTAITGTAGADTLTLTQTGTGAFDFSTRALTAVETVALVGDVDVTVDAADLAGVTNLTVAGASTQKMTLNDTDDLSGITFSAAIDRFTFGNFAVTLDANNITNMDAITGSGGAATEVILNDNVATDLTTTTMTGVTILDAAVLNNKALTVNTADLADTTTVQGDNGDSNDLIIADTGDLTGTQIVDGFDTLQLNGTGTVIVDSNFFNLGTGDFAKIDDNGGTNAILQIDLTAAGTYDFGGITVGATNHLQAININGTAGNDIIELWNANGDAAGATPTVVTTGTGNDQIRLNIGSGNDTPGSGNAALTIANAISVVDFDAGSDQVAFATAALTNNVIHSLASGAVTAGTHGFVYINNATVNDFTNIGQVGAAVGALTANAAAQTLAFAIKNTAGNQVGIYAFTDSDADTNIADVADDLTLVGVLNVTNGAFDLANIAVF